MRTLEKHELLMDLDRPLYAVAAGNGSGPVEITDAPGTAKVLAVVPPMPVHHFGAPSFRSAHGVRAAYVAGSMAGGIGSIDVVAAMAEAGLMAGYGAGGLDLGTVEKALVGIKHRLGARTNYKVNLLHNPARPELEMKTAEMFLAHQVRRVSASAYMTLTPAIVLYRARGLSEAPDGTIRADNHVLAKISRTEVAEKFMRPAPADLLRRLVADGRLTEHQAKLAERVPMAEDLTAEGDSAGHTDRRPAIPLLTTIAELRDRIAEEQRYDRPIRVGSAGGIGTPSAALAAFMAGADYVLTGSINQSCVEAGTSDLVKSMLAKVDLGGVDMAPAADMFELGVRVQVLKQDTLFVPRGEKLYRLYTQYESLDEIPARERAQLEVDLFM